MLRGLWRKFDRDWGWNLARLLAYACLQMLFAAAGLLLIVLALALRFASPALQASVSTAIVHYLPDRITSTAVSSFERSLQYAPGWLLIAGIPLVLWEGSRFFVVLESTLCIIFRRRQRSFAPQNRVALAMLLLLALLLPVIVFSATVIPPIGISTTTGTVGTHSLAAIGYTHYTQDPLIATLGFCVGLAANFLLFFVAYRWVTPGSISVRAAWPGALVGACLAQLYLLIFPFYTHNVLHPDHFGTVAGFVLVILVFFFAYSLFIVIGAELAAWHEGYRAAVRDIPTTLVEAYDADTSMLPLATGPQRIAALQSMPPAVSPELPPPYAVREMA
jgi:uncharacterized BrkB/YihY/UPF0761 family membrane protein